MVAYSLFPSPPIILIAVLVGLICVFFLASSETRRSAGKVLAGMMIFAGVAVLAYLALRVFGVPLGRASGALVPSVPNQSVMMFGSIVILLLMVLIPVALLLAFAFGKKEPKSPMAPALVKEPSGPSAGKMLGGVAAGAGATLLILAVIFTVVGKYRGSRVRMELDRNELRMFHDLTGLEAMSVPDRPRGLDEPLIVLNDEAKEPNTTATEPEEESTSDGEKADEKPLEESVDEQPNEEPPEENEKPTTVAKSPSGDEPPAWVGRGAFRDESVYMTPVTLDPGPTRTLCEEELLLPAVRTAILAYTNEMFPDAAQGVGLPDDEYIRSHMIGNDIWEEPIKIDSFSELDQKLWRDVWGEAANRATDDWIRLHALVKFDRDVNQRIEEASTRMLRFERLQGVGALMVVAMLALASLYAYMRFDLATAGAYRNRLRVAALTAIMIAILGVVLMR